MNLALRLANRTSVYSLICYRDGGEGWIRTNDMTCVNSASLWASQLHPHIKQIPYLIKSLWPSPYLYYPSNIFNHVEDEGWAKGSDPLTSPSCLSAYLATERLLTLKFHPNHSAKLNTILIFYVFVLILNSLSFELLFLWTSLISYF